MRFKITLHIDEARYGKSLPLSYQYELSSWLYKVIHVGDASFSTWLHDCGYLLGSKTFKLFSFSRIQIKDNQYTINNDRLVIKSNEIFFFLSFHIKSAAEPFIHGLFLNQEGTIGDHISKVGFHVSQIERLPEPVFCPTMRFRLLSPLVINSFDGKNGRYLGPEDVLYEGLFFQNLIHKYTAVTLFLNAAPDKKQLEEETQMKLTLLNVPKSKLVTVKTGTTGESKIRGFIFDFELLAPVEIIRTGYETGFGEKNSLGFGFASLKSN